MRYPALVLLAASMLTGPLQAATLVQDDDWSVILFHGVGEPILDGVTSEPVFNFTVVGSGLLRITDALALGDRFQLTINGIVQAPTSIPGVGPILVDADLAYNSGYYSRGAYKLAPGNYTVTGIATVSPFGIGNAYIGLTTAVPEPATWTLVITGFGVAGFTMRRRRLTGIVSN